MTDTSQINAEKSRLELEKIQAETALTNAESKFAGVRFYLWVAVAFAVGTAFGIFVI